jgi:Vault protein inter-alpha-trypsin domain
MTTDIAPLTTEHAAEPEAGLGALATSRGNLPLDAVDIRATIAGTSATVELTQGFHNPFDTPLEATYIFPLPDRADLGLPAAAPVPLRAPRERGQEMSIRAAAGRKAVTKPSARPVRAPYQGRSARHVGDADRLVQARRQIADEVAALRTAHHVPDAERARILADLATRIESLLVWVTEDPAAAGRLTGLTTLTRKLRECDKPGSPRGAELDALWEEAIRLLAGFAAQDSPDDAAEAQPGGVRPAAHHAFWKRPR